MDRLRHWICHDGEGDSVSHSQNTRKLLIVVVLIGIKLKVISGGWRPLSSRKRETRRNHHLSVWLASLSSLVQNSTSIFNRASHTDPETMAAQKIAVYSLPGNSPPERFIGASS